MKFEFSPYIAVQVKDYDKAKKFYEEVLGMEIIESSEKETHFKKDGINFCMENSGSGSTFFEFKVDDVITAKKELEKEGCRVTETYSDKSLMFADPYGMKFHVWSE